jgi:hypothetical protein
MIRRRVEPEEGMTREQLEWNAFVEILSKHEYEELEPVQRIPYLAFWYEGHVQNGGHELHFDIRGTERLQEALDALTIMGAHGQREVLERAAEVWLSQPREQYEAVDECLEDEEDDLAVFDFAYGNCRPDMETLLERYLIKHKECFIEE